ncbi:MAG: tandem-95 repeat protein, partial [Gammaproteobacteria bacterium]|nr:tandem-95 repeat protein [Gammaproteobacteria bacterium]
AVYTLNTGSSTTLDITVRPVDDASVVQPDSQIIDEDTVATGNVLGNDSDIDSTLSVVSFTINGQSYTAGQTAVLDGIGSLVINADGTYSFTPAANWNGVMPQAVYTLNTGSSTTLDITVRPVDDASVVQPDSQIIDEDTVATSNVLGNDSDIDSTLSVVSFTIDGQSYTAGQTAVLDGIGSLVINADGTYTFTPAANWNGVMPQAVYTLNTGSSTTLDITVRPVDDASVVQPDSQIIDEDTVATGNVLGNDSDIDSTLSVVSFTIDGQSYTAGQTAVLDGIGSLVINADGTYSFTPAANWNGVMPQAVYTLNTGSSTTLDITVRPVGDASVIGGDDSGAVSEDNVLVTSGTLTVSDPDGSTGFHAETITDGDYGTFTLNADGSWSYTLNNANPTVQALTAADSLVRTFTVLTADGTSHTVTVTITGADEAGGGGGGGNDPTNAVNDTNTVNEGETASGNVLSNDTDVDDVLSVASFSIAGEAGPFVVGAAYVIAGVGSLTLNANGAYSFVPAADWNGTVPVVSYTTNTGATATLTITVNPVDDSTNAVNDTNTVNEGETATGNVLSNDTDVDDVLSVASFTIAGQAGLFVVGTTYVIAGVGSLTLNANGAYSFVPAADWNGTVPVVSYTTNTGATATLTITVNPLDDSTNAVNDTNTVNEGETAAGNVLSNDSDVDDVLSVASFSIAGEAGPFVLGSAYVIAGVGSLTLNANGAYSFVPAADWNGTVPVISYTTNTGATATLTITVNPLDDSTNAVNDTNTVNEGETASGNVLSNDTDADDVLSVASFSIAGQAGPFVLGSAYVIAGVGSLTLNANGAYSFVPAADWNGTVPVVSYTTNTGATATLTITVNPVDDATNAVNDTNTVDEGETASGNVLSNDTDVDDVLSVASFTIAGQAGPFVLGSAYVIAGVGSLTLNANGAYSFVPAADWNGSVPVVSYTTNTGATATLSITVNPVDDSTNAVNDTNTVDEGETATGNVLSNDTDADDVLSVASFTIAGQAGPFVVGAAYVIAGVGSLTLNANGSYSFVPAADWNGTVPVVSYTTNTGATATLSITVNPLPDAPTANDSSATGSEDPATPIAVTITGADVDGNLQSFVIDSLPANGTLYLDAAMTQAVTLGMVLAAGAGSLSLYFQPNTHWSGDTGFGFHTLDAGGLSSAGATATITVTPVADTPNLSLTSLSGSGFLTTWDSAANESSTSQRVDQTQFDGWTRIDTPDGQAGGANTFELWHEGDSMANQAGSNITIHGSPNSNAANNSWLELNDSNGLAQTIGIERTFNTVAGALYTFELDYAGRAGFGTDYTNIAIYLDGNLIGTYAGTSPQDALDWEHLLTRFVGDGLSHTLRIITQPSATHVNGRGAMLDNLMLTEERGVLAGNANGGADTRIDLSNYLGTSLVDTDGSETLSLRISDLPAGARVYSADQPGGYAVVGGVVTIPASQLASAYVLIDGAYTGTLNLGISAIATESDGGQALASQTLSLNIAGGGSGISASQINQAPDANNDTAVTMSEDATRVITVLGNDRDADGDSLSVVSAVSAQGGTIVINADGTLSYTPPANYSGSDTITYTVSDGQGGTDTATIAITVNAVNDAPVLATPSVINGTEDLALSITGISVSDVDAGSNSIQVRFSVGAGAGTFSASSSGGVTASLNGSQRTLTLTGTLADINAYIAASLIGFNPAANANGDFNMTVTVNDQASGNPLSDSETVVIRLAAVPGFAPDAPDEPPTEAQGHTVAAARVQEDEARDRAAGVQAGPGSDGGSEHGKPAPEDDISLPGQGEGLFLLGEEGGEVFVFQLTELGAPALAADTVLGFDARAVAEGGDVLDLRDLLQGETATADSLDAYLNFRAEGGDTVIEVHSQGAGMPADQRIVLQGVDLTAGGNLSDQQILEQLLNHGNLRVDPGV